MNPLAVFVWTLADVIGLGLLALVVLGAGVWIAYVCLAEWWGRACARWQAWRARRAKPAAVDMPCWFAVVDCETTALDAERGSLLSIGAIVPATGARYYGECRAHLEAVIEEGALAVNGASLERVTNPELLTEAELIADFARWMRRQGIRLIGGKNPSFDRDWLKAAWRRANMPGHYPLTHRTIDLHSLAWAWALRNRPEVLVESNTLKSDDLYVMMGLPPEPRPHHALTGAVMEAKAFAWLLGAESEGGVFNAKIAKDAKSEAGTPGGKEGV